MSAAAKALDAWEAANATAGHWHPTVNRYETIDEAVAAYRHCLVSTPEAIPTVRGVMAWDHPETVIGSDPTRPETATMVAIVGNGPDGESNALAIALRHNLSAQLAAVARAAMAYRNDGYLGADGMQHHTPEVVAALDAALDALEEGGLWPNPSSFCAAFRTLNKLAADADPWVWVIEFERKEPK